MTRARDRAPLVYRLAVICVVVLLFSVNAGCQQRVPDTVVNEPDQPEPAVVEKPAIEWAIALHGGAGVIDRDSLEDPEDYYSSLQSALRAGSDALADGKAALEVVELVVTLLEDDPLFNAGKGAVLNSQGAHELDAAIMDGRTLACGAVAGVRTVKNPLSLARRVMERTPHVLLVGQGAESFAREQGLRTVSPSYFTTERRLRQWRESRRAARAANRASNPRQPDSGLGTVGVVAFDRYGNLAAGTSTGGLTNKKWGRVGDVPIIGAGTYANNKTAAISCTGRGEEFIRHVAAHDVAARMAYAGLTLQEAATKVLTEDLAPGDGGLIAVDRTGQIVMEFSTDGMFRGAADSAGRFDVAIWHETRSPVSPPSSPSQQLNPR